MEIVRFIFIIYSVRRFLHFFFLVAACGWLVECFPHLIIICTIQIYNQSFRVFRLCNSVCNGWLPPPPPPLPVPPAQPDDEVVFVWLVEKLLVIFTAAEVVDVTFKPVACVIDDAVCDCMNVCSLSNNYREKNKYQFVIDNWNWKNNLQITKALRKNDQLSIRNWDNYPNNDQRHMQWI